MKKENYFNQMLKIELAVGKQYGDTRLLAMKEFLEDIPDDEWPFVVRDTIRECGKELPSVGEIRRNRWKLW